MHTAALPQALAHPVRATGVAGWAIRTGRALERWGRTRAARRHGAGPEASAHLAAAARAAVAERDELHRSAAIPLR
ncbi:hypothetical protein [Agromyces aerolatus]|uniref:hypothetical protein n=1 Tax=Agromyces sp. LY-1074 TaxID=3074080 RepID=UPI002864121F|nr:MULTISPECIES: hypothetical protein [unclassified Agromyces]MDR5701053.1 hypothetical protein [Agromyces sp. LY-1074]MDR5707693.1 hypothetical protein [Agromyces sp. LY-1358]